VATGAGVLVAAAGVVLGVAVSVGLVSGLQPFMPTAITAATTAHRMVEYTRIMLLLLLVQRLDESEGTAGSSLRKDDTLTCIGDT
jgi:hypothetical protein